MTAEPTHAAVMANCICCTGHQPHITASRAGCYVWCDCGWKSKFHHADAVSASLAWAHHIASLDHQEATA